MIVWLKSNETEKSKWPESSDQARCLIHILNHIPVLGCYVYVGIRKRVCNEYIKLLPQN